MVIWSVSSCHYVCFSYCIKKTERWLADVRWCTQRCSAVIGWLVDYTYQWRNSVIIMMIYKISIFYSLIPISMYYRNEFREVIWVYLGAVTKFSFEEHFLGRSNLCFDSARGRSDLFSSFVASGVCCFPPFDISSTLSLEAAFRYPRCENFISLEGEGAINFGDISHIFFGAGVIKEDFDTTVQEVAVSSCEYVLDERAAILFDSC